jgi:hypothetical protein
LPFLIAGSRHSSQIAATDSGIALTTHSIRGENEMKVGLLLVVLLSLYGCANLNKTEQRMVSGAAIGGVLAGPIGAGVGAGIGYVVQRTE